MEDAERRNGIAHADERIDHGTYRPSGWRWEGRGSLDAILVDLIQLADAANAMGFAIHTYRGRLRQLRDES